MFDQPFYRSRNQIYILIDVIKIVSKESIHLIRVSIKKIEKMSDTSPTFTIQFGCNMTRCDSLSPTGEWFGLWFVVSSIRPHFITFRAYYGFNWANLTWCSTGMSNTTTIVNSESICRVTVIGFDWDQSKQSSFQIQIFMIIEESNRLIVFISLIFIVIQ